MNREIDEYLNNFKLKDPPSALQHNIIANASKYWVEAEDNFDLDLTPRFRLAVKIFFSAAAVVTIAILCLNTIFYSPPEIDDKYESEIRQLVDLGVSKNIAKMMIVVRKNKSNKFTSYKNYLLEDKS